VCDEGANFEAFMQIVEGSSSESQMNICTESIFMFTVVRLYISATPKSTGETLRINPCPA